MKKLLVLLLVSVSSVTSTFAQDCTVAATLPYLEDLSNGDPACWEYENTDAAAPEWAFNNGIDLTGNGTNDPFMGLIPANVSNREKDDWAFTQKIQMEAGIAYAISVDYNSLGLGNAVANENFELVITDAPNSTASFSEVLGTYNDITQQGSFPGSAGDNVLENAYTAQESFTPTTSGEYYVAIHALGASGNDSGVFMVFNTIVEEAPIVCEAVTVPYNEDFENEDPACWAYENTDGFGPEWMYNNSVDIDGDGTNDPLLSITPPSVQDVTKDDWAFTQKIQMEAGTEYFVSAHYNTINLGTATAHETFELVVLDAPNSNAAFQAVLETYGDVTQQGAFPGNNDGEDIESQAYFTEKGFTPTTTGEYYVAIHATGSNSTQAAPLLIFDIAVNDTPIGPDCTEVATVPYAEDFSNGSPECWEYENTDTAAPEWVFNDSVDIDGDGTNDPILTLIPNNVSATAKDDWAFSKKIQLIADAEYQISAYYNALNLGNASASENFELVITDAPDSGSIVEVLGTYNDVLQQGDFPGNNDGNDVESQAYLAEEIFTPTSTGEYYIAIHATGTNGAEAGGFLLFDVAIESYIEPGDGELLLFSQSTISGVNGNGSSAVGFNSSENLLWQEATGIEAIGGINPQNGVGGDVKISDDGNTVIGPYTNPENGLKEMSMYDVPTETWTSLGGIGGQSGEQISSAWGISADASTIVGLGWLPTSGAHAISWTESTGVVDLGSTVPDASSRANNVSGDGSVVVGWQDTETGFRQAAVWTNGVQQVISFPNGDRAQEAGAISNDGVWIGGNGNFANNFQAYRWSEATGIESLGPALQPGWRGATTALSEDGSVVVGFYRPQGPALFGSGFIWTEALGVTDLNEYAEALGIDTQGIVMSLPLDISADGSTIVGAGRDTNNQRVGFILKLDETILGTETITPTLDITYYPNPVRDILNISSPTEIENISIYAVTGQEVLTKALNGANTLDVSSLSNGIYFVKAFGKNTSTTFRIIKN
ncbi:T9SS type A sorting domain-containing protein [Marixanthomonas ophiurae]|uniref:T9SS C-terminal target domain-containing protein n=1 Tax=Marixanthomonas ophiurae TaxID=387659 RepID=A0A3E1QCZ2_9FLAO|nr:T9SS type A sorting domain-containing protein [Marixanthomonas ophiurae]RFN60019.1 T9SS C-terminal target domain-containing protein [Marixanthomonas ophiurae]